MSCIGILLVIVGLGGVGTKHRKESWGLIILGSLLIAAERAFEVYR